MGERSPDAPGGGRWFWWWVAASCAGGLALRLVYALVVKAGALLVGDAFYYHWQAYYNTKGRWFVDPLVAMAKHPNLAELPSAQHPPLFTLFLTVGDYVGLTSVHDQLVLVCLVGTATIALAALVARELASPRAGAVAAVVGALYPGLWVYDGEVMSEALLMLITLVTIFVALRCFRRCTVRRVMLLGVMVGLCALTRAEMVLLVPLVALPTVLWQRAFARRRRVVLGLVAVVFALLPMGPWFVRNAVVFHHPVYLSDQLPITLAAANNRQSYEGPFSGSWCYSCLIGVHFPKGADESDQAAYWAARARRYVEAHLSQAAFVAVERLGLEWNVYAPLRQVEQNFTQGWPEPVSMAWMIWFYPLFVSSVAGVVVLRRRRVPVFPLVSMFVVVSLVAVLTYGNYRFRAEAEVAMVVLAAVAAEALWVALAGRPSGPSAPDGGAALEIGPDARTPDPDSKRVPV